MKVDIQHNAGRFISHISRRMFRQMSEYLSPYNINFSQFTYLMSLYSKQGLTQQELSQQLCLDKATTARTLDVMEETGLIERRPNPKDKRAYRIYLTKQGYKLHDEIICVIEQINQDLTGGMTEDEIKFLMALLARVEQNLIAKDNQKTR